MITPRGPGLQRLGFEVVARLFDSRQVCTMSGVSAASAKESLSARLLLLLVGQGETAQADLLLLTRAWQPLLFTAWSAAPLDTLDFAIQQETHVAEAREPALSNGARFSSPRALFAKPIALTSRGVTSFGAAATPSHLYTLGGYFGRAHEYTSQG